MLSSRKPTRLEERWTKPIDLLTPFKITKSDGKPLLRNSNPLSKDLLVMSQRHALSYLTADHLTLNSELSSSTSTSIMILWLRRFQYLKVFSSPSSWSMQPPLVNGTWKVFLPMIFLSRTVSWSQDHPDIHSWSIHRTRLTPGSNQESHSLPSKTVFSLSLTQTWEMLLSGHSKKVSQYSLNPLRTKLTQCLIQFLKDKLLSRVDQSSLSLLIKSSIMMINSDSTWPQDLPTLISPQNLLPKPPLLISLSHKVVSSNSSSVDLSPRSKSILKIKSKPFKKKSPWTPRSSLIMKMIFLRDLLMSKVPSLMIQILLMC